MWKRSETVLDFCFELSDGTGALPDATLLEGGSAHLPIYQKLLWKEMTAQMILPRNQYDGMLSWKIHKIQLDTLDQSA